MYWTMGFYEKTVLVICLKIFPADSYLLDFPLSVVTMFFYVGGLC